MGRKSTRFTPPESFDQKLKKKTRERQEKPSNGHGCGGVLEVEGGHSRHEIFAVWDLGGSQGVELGGTAFPQKRICKVPGGEQMQGKLTSAKPQEDSRGRRKKKQPPERGRGKTIFPGQQTAQKLREKHCTRGGSRRVTEEN